ncbi:MAG: ATP-binding protein [Holophaga sp.]
MLPFLAKWPASFARSVGWVFAGTATLGFICLLLPLWTRGFLMAAFSIAIALTAAWLFLRRARAGGNTRTSFYLVAFALLLHSALTLIKLLAECYFPWMDFGFNLRLWLDLTVPALLGAAVFTWPTSTPGLSFRWRECLDALLFTISVFLVFWLLGLGGLFAEAPLPFHQKIAELSFFLTYALIMGLTIYRGLNAPGRFASPLGWILAAFIVASAGDLIFVALLLRNNYYPGHPMDSLGLLIRAFYLLAALAPVLPTPEVEKRRSRFASLLMPYLPLLLALPLVFHRFAHRAVQQDSVALWLGTGMICILLLRQLVALWDSMNFSRSLELQVHQRTLALEESQAMLLRTQRMNLLATLGAGLAHDLNNLLSVVTMSTDLLEEELEPNHHSPARKDLDTMRKAATQAGDLVKKLMTFGRRGENQPQLFDLRERVQGISKLLEKLATASVRVQWDLGPEPLFLEVDPIQIEQVLVNLVANARDAMPKGGTLRIGTKRSEGTDGARAILSIADTGTGISEDNLKHLFVAFFTTKEPGKGTGLGLASVKAIADECGASIEVESAVGVGTIFTLSFPMVSVAETPIS